MSKYYKLLNIAPPEEVIFKFSGKLGRLSLMWETGEWIITNKRLIFLGKNISFGGKPPFSWDDVFSHFRRKLAFIILLEEISEIKKKKTKIIIRYNPYRTDSMIIDTRELSIGFLNKSYRNYESNLHPLLIDEIYNFLTRTLAPDDSIFCPHCQLRLPQHTTHCLNCDATFNQCKICKFPIVGLDEQIECPNCLSFFHKREFLEWIKIRGHCPNCNFKMNQYIINPLSST